MSKSEGKGKATMIQFTAGPIENNFIAAEPTAAETEAAKDIPTKGTKQDGIDTLKVGDYFKVKNKKPWKYYQKTSENDAPKIKLTDIDSTVNEEKKSVRDGIDTLKIGDYFKVAQGDNYKYYQKTSAKGARTTTLADIIIINALLEKTKEPNIEKYDALAEKTKEPNFEQYNALWDEKNTSTIDTVKSTSEGIDTVKIGEYFKVKNKTPWKYYQKISDKGTKKLKKEDYKDGTIMDKISDGLKTLKINDYFKVKNGDYYIYYQKNSAKGTRKIPSSVALNLKLRRNDEADSFVEKGDYMKNVVTSSSLPEKVQENDTNNVENDPKFSISQLRRSASVFKSLVNLKWVKKSATNVIGGAKTQEEMNRKKYLNRKYQFLDIPIENSIHTFHTEGTIRDFMQIFAKIKIEIEGNGQVRCPTGETMHTYHFKYQVGYNVIYINRLKINIYLFLLRRTPKFRRKKLSILMANHEALRFLTLACSIGLPTREFTKAVDFFRVFSSKYTKVNDENVIRTLLSLNKLENTTDDIGNNTLQMLKIYDENFFAFKQGNYSLSNDPRDKHRSKELYSKPTPTELKHILSRAGKVVDSLLKKETEQKEQKSEQKEQKSEQKEQKSEQKEQKEQKTTLFMFDE
jgi:hypothetical protein